MGLEVETTSVVSATVHEAGTMEELERVLEGFRDVGVPIGAMLKWSPGAEAGKMRLTATWHPSLP